MGRGCAVCCTTAGAAGLQGGQDAGGGTLAIWGGDHGAEGGAGGSPGNGPQPPVGAGAKIGGPPIMGGHPAGPQPAPHRGGAAAIQSVRQIGTSHFSSASL